MILSLLLFLIRILLGGVFFYSGWSKLMVPVQNFAAVIEGYQFLSPPLVMPLASVLPWLELTFGTFLLLGFLIRTSASVLAFFLITFVVLLSRSLLLHLPITECGCFGAGITLAPWQALFLDSGLFLASLVLIFFPAQLCSLDRRLRQ